MLSKNLKKKKKKRMTLLTYVLKCLFLNKLLFESDSISFDYTDILKKWNLSTFEYIAVLNAVFLLQGNTCNCIVIVT